MLFRPSIAIFFTLLWWAVWAYPFAHGDEVLRSRVLKDAPREWTRFRERSENRASVMVIKSGPLGVETATNKFTSQSRGSWKLIIQEALASNSEPVSQPLMRVSVFGINDQYYFELKAQQREGPFKLVKLQKIAPEDVGKTIPRELFIRSWPEENDFIFVAVEALPEIFSKPYFQLRSAEFLTEGERQYIRCKIGYNHQKSDRTIPFGKAWIPYSEFTLDLDPDNYYQIRRVTYELSNEKNTYVFTDEISQGSGTASPQYLFEHKSVDKTSGRLLHTERQEYALRSFSAPPKSDFYLSAFGLPEPPGFEKPGVPIFVWLGGAGLILVVAGLFWHRYRKTAA